MNATHPHLLIAVGVVTAVWFFALGAWWMHKRRFADDGRLIRLMIDGDPVVWVVERYGKLVKRLDGLTDREKLRLVDLALEQRTDSSLHTTLEVAFHLLAVPAIIIHLFQ